MMPISKVVKAWCGESNARTGANRCFAAFLAVIVVCVGVMHFTEGYAPLAGLVAVLAVLVWYAFAPKAIHLGQLRSSIHRDSFAPDSLLAKIADAGDVPKWIKTELADKLKTDGRVSFGLLFELDGWLTSGAEQAKIEQGSGYRKMMAYMGREEE